MNSGFWTCTFQVYIWILTKYVLKAEFFPIKSKLITIFFYCLLISNWFKIGKVKRNFPIYSKPRILFLLHFSTSYIKVYMKMQAFSEEKFRTRSNIRHYVLQSFPLADDWTEVQILGTWPKSESSWGIEHTETQAVWSRAQSSFQYRHITLSIEMQRSLLFLWIPQLLHQLLWEKSNTHSSSTLNHLRLIVNTSS